MLLVVAGLVVVVPLKSWLVRFWLFDVFGCCSGGGQNTTTGLQILFLGGQRQHLVRGVQKATTGLQLLFLGCGRGSKYVY